MQKCFKGSKKLLHNFKETILPSLWPQGKELSQEKIKDLKELLKLLPADCKDFYNFLKRVKAGNFDDDIDGFGEVVDFEIEDKVDPREAVD